MRKIGVVSFPGTIGEQDIIRAVKLSGAEPVSLSYACDSVSDLDAVILPGGFSYGDYLRPGAIASFAPIMGEIVDKANAGLPVLGIGNGFQLLCEAGLLPGGLVKNSGGKFVCRQQRLRVETVDTVWSCSFQLKEEIVLALKSGQGNYQADAETIKRLEENHQIVLRYLDNPNGSKNNIAGITNARGNVVGIMPHPEHNVEFLTAPSTDGLNVFVSAQIFLNRAEQESSC